MSGGTTRPGRRVDAVEPEDGVEVDDAACLELGDFGVGEPDAGAVAAGEPVEAAPQGDDGAAPQLGSVAVPDDGRVVVVAVRAQRLAEAAVVVLVPLAAGQATAVRAGGVLAPGAAAQDLAARAWWPGVDGSEGWCGEGGEDAGWMATDSGMPLPPASPARMSW